MWEQKETTVEPSKPTVSDQLGGVGMVVLETQLELFPAIYYYVKNHYTHPSLVLTPDSIETISIALRTDSELLNDCISFMDNLHLLSKITTGDVNGFKDVFIDILQTTRVFKRAELCINANDLDYYMYSNYEDLHDFLVNNSLIFCIYIYATLRMMFSFDIAETEG